MSIDPYEVLGVGRDATPEAIKAAYRLKAKAAHPDSGGSDEAFTALGLAHRVLSDPEKRRKYDETGSIDDAADRSQASALQLIHAAIAAVMNDDDAIYRDLVAEARVSITADLRKAETMLTGGLKTVARAERLRKRFRAKSGPDFIGQMIEAQVENAGRVISQLQGNIVVIKLALEMLADAEFQPDKRPIYTPQYASTNIMGALLGGTAGRAPGVGR